MSGSGGDVGYDYQADATAFVAAHGLSKSALGWFDDINDVPSEWWAETSGPGDDIRVITRDGHIIEVQAKHAFTRGEDYIAAFRRMISGLKGAPELRGAILVDRHASAIIRGDLKQDIVRVGAGRTDNLKPITLDLLRDLGESATAVADVFARMRVIVVDLDEGSDGMRLACALLNAAVPADKTTAAFQWLGKRCHGLIKHRSRDTAQTCLNALKTQFGEATGSAPQGGTGHLISNLLLSQLENMSSHLAQDAELELEHSRAAWRSGRKSEAASTIARLREPARWNSYSDELKAKILRFQALIAFDAGDLTRSKELGDEIEHLSPGSNARLLALIARAGGDVSGALGIVANRTDPESITLRSALLLETGKTKEALDELEELQNDPEALRLRALARVLERDLAAARLEIEKASQLQPSWHSIIQSRMVIEYLSGLSPAVLLPIVPSIPEPVEWAFVKTGDADRQHFHVAAECAMRLLREGEPNPEERRALETWAIASSCNDPERLGDATELSKEVLARDPSNFMVMVWASARALEIDCTAPVDTLRSRLLTGQGSVAEAIALLERDLASAQFESAIEVLQATDQLFAKSGNAHLSRLFRAQIAARKPDLGATIATPSDQDSDALGVRLTNLHVQALLTGDLAPLITELKILSDRGDGRSTFELCRLLARERKWREATPYARLLPARLQTAESIRLACVILYNANYPEECIRFLDANRSWFPHGRLGAELLHLRVAAARAMGLIPSAAAAAEEIFRHEQSRTNLMLLAQLYLGMGDFVSLANLARSNFEAVDLLASDLILLAMWLSHEERAIAVEMWRRAMALGVPDSEVTLALDTAYKLGLDNETRPLIERLPTLPEGHVKSFSLQEAMTFLLERRSGLERAYELYRQGDIYIHLLSKALHRPLSWWYHRAPLENRKSGFSIAGPTFAVHGWRVGPISAFDGRDKVRLNADLTALLTAAHLNLLPEIENVFSPIRLPQRTLLALVAMKDNVKPVQPARQPHRRSVWDLVRQKEISIIELAESVPRKTFSEIRAAEIRNAANNGWLVIDFPSPAVDASDPPDDEPSLTNIMRSPHALRDALVELGELSKEEGDRAADHLGQVLEFGSDRQIPRGVGLLLGGSCLETLASAGLLVPATRAYKLMVTRDDYASLEAEIAAFERSQEDADWLNALIHRVNRGIDSGSYELMAVDVTSSGEDQEETNFSLEAFCLREIFQFVPGDADLIWVDDRFITGFTNRDGVPIVSTSDVIHHLHNRGVISDATLFDYLHQLRECDFRFLALATNELEYHIVRAPVTQGRVSETRQLRNIRRYYARCLSDGAVLRVSAEPKKPGVEWQFLMYSASSVNNSLFTIANATDTSEVVFARREWLLRNLYAPDKGRAFTTAPRDSQSDLRLEAVSLAALLARTEAVSLTDSSARRSRRAFLSWICSRLVQPRFDVDPALRMATLDVFKGLVTHSLKGITDPTLRRYAAALTSTLIEDMPQELIDVLSEDREFADTIGVKTYAVVRLGEYSIPADVFWKAVTQSMNSSAAVTVECAGSPWSISLQGEQGAKKVFVEKTDTQGRFVLTESLEVMSDSIAERERALRTMADSFDLPLKDADAAIARVSLIPDLGGRMEEVARLRRGSAVLRYDELAGKLRNHEPVFKSDFLDCDVELLLRHLRIPSGTSFSVENLNDAALSLIEDVGPAEAITRMASLPVPLPTAIVSRLEAMGVEERQIVFKLLRKRLNSSPLGVSHLARLMTLFSEDSPAYARYARRLARKLALDSEEHISASIAIVQFLADKMMLQDSYRASAPALRLIACWSHGDALYRMLTAAGSKNQHILEWFDNRPGRLQAELIFGRDESSRDVTTPGQLEPFPTGLALAWNAANGNQDIIEGIAGILGPLLARDLGKAATLLGAVRPRLNVLNSFLTPDWLGLLPRELQQEIAFNALESRCGDTLRGFVEGTSKIQEWAFVDAVLGGYIPPMQLQQSLRDAIDATDLRSILDSTEERVFTVLVPLARQAAIAGRDVVDTARGKLVDFAKAMNAQSLENTGQLQERTSEALLSAAFELYRTDTPNEQSYKDLAELLWVLVSEHNKLAEVAQQLVDALVQGLPNLYSRLFWELQIRLRAVR